MPPSTRSQTTREAAATNPTPTENNSVRLRQLAGIASTQIATQRPPSGSEPDEPPHFVIDLSLPPEQRYLEICSVFKDRFRNLVPLFDEVVSDFIKFMPRRWVHRVCRLVLRGVREEEENRELKGISKATGVEMYLLVCFNVLLDLFMGCTSGGGAVSDGEGGSKMLHYRTLDWGMASLRRIVVQLHFKMESQGPIVASSITYAGYVGVLTGVRKDFSVSLNFRPSRNDKYKFWADAKYFWHLLMVLLGKRRSISSDLRRLLLPSRASRHSSELKSDTGGWNFLRYNDAVLRMRRATTTACYLCFCNGKETTVMEKDRVTAVVRKSEDFIVITNNDIDHADEATINRTEESPFAGALAEIVHEAKDRRECAEHNYHNARISKARRFHKTADLKTVMGLEDMVWLVERFPTTNEMTHFACILDPREGAVRWCRRWKRPVTAKWIREHQSETW